MEIILGIFVALFFLSAIALLIYTIIYPEKMALWGERWKYNNADLEPSEASIDFRRMMAIVGLIVLVIGAVVFIIQIV